MFVIFRNRWRHILGERDFWEHVGGIDVYLAPSSFGQANTRAFDSLLQKLHKYVPLSASVTDLYAGAGVIGLSLASTRKCRKDLSVRCVEINKESKLAFEKTIERLLSSLYSSISWHHADTSLNALRLPLKAHVLCARTKSCAPKSDSPTNDIEEKARPELAVNVLYQSAYCGSSLVVREVARSLYALLTVELLKAAHPSVIRRTSEITRDEQHGLHLQGM
ncbi:uncharacterized RNA methyltransferase [Tanacetum coccineum]